MADASRPLVYNKALELLALRPHFRRELGSKLQRRGYEAEEVEDVLGRLTERGFLDEDETARSFVAGRLARGPVGERRLRAELSRRGVEPEVVDRALAELVPDDDVAPARQAAAAWLRSKRHPRPDALARFLDRKGFSGRAIRAALDDLASHVEELEEGAPRVG